MATRNVQRLGRKVAEPAETAQTNRRSINKEATDGSPRRLNAVPDADETEAVEESTETSDLEPADESEAETEPAEQPETDTASSANEAPAPKKRGRKPGSTNAARVAASDTVTVTVSGKPNTGNSTKRTDLALLSDTVMEFAATYNMTPLDTLIATQTLLRATGDIPPDDD